MNTVGFTRACNRHEDGGAWIERKHPINDVDEIVSTPFDFTGFSKEVITLSFSRMEWNEMDGWMDMDGEDESRSLRQVAFLARVGEVKKRT